MPTLPAEVNLLILETVVVTSPTSILPFILTCRDFYQLFKAKEAKYVRTLVESHVGDLKPFTKLLLDIEPSYKPIEPGPAAWLEELEGRRVVVLDDELVDFDVEEDAAVIPDRYQTFILKEIFRKHTLGTAVIRYLCELSASPTAIVPDEALVLELYFLRLVQISHHEPRYDYDDVFAAFHDLCDDYDHPAADFGVVQALREEREEAEAERWRMQCLEGVTVERSEEEEKLERCLFEWFHERAEWQEGRFNNGIIGGGWGDFF